MPSNACSQDSGRFGVADLVYIGFTLLLLAVSNRGMVDDPGLGWHLRIVDQMLESGGFLYEDTFTLASTGKPWLTQAWLGDIPLRMAYQWAGLNGIAALTAMTFALTFRLLFMRMLHNNVPWLWALGWVFLAALGTQVAWVARPNMFTFVGLVITVTTCERFHAGQLSERKTLWLVPLFWVWANTHGGFLSGALILCATYLYECYGCVYARDAARRSEFRHRFRWLSFLGVLILGATLVNPYGVQLYTWQVSMVGSEFIRTSTTQEWLPPDFTSPGWFRLEFLLLLFPLLAAISRHRAKPLSIIISVLWLHFALTGRRYTPLWVIVSVPLLASLSYQTPWIDEFRSWLRRHTSMKYRERFGIANHRQPFGTSLVFSGILLVGCRFLSPLAAHDPQNMPTAGLDELLREYQGERVFHSVNWGGYLTWHGWNDKPRFRNWIDDRLDLHGPVHIQEYTSIMSAAAGWDDLLDQRDVELLCIPTTSRLAIAIDGDARWVKEYRDGQIVICRRTVSRQTSP